MCARDGSFWNEKFAEPRPNVEDKLSSALKLTDDFFQLIFFCYSNLSEVAPNSTWCSTFFSGFGQYELMKWLELSFKCQLGVDLKGDSFLKTICSRTTPLITRVRAGIPKGREFNWSEEKTWKLHEDLSPEGSREDRGNTQEGRTSTKEVKHLRLR